MRWRPHRMRRTQMQKPRKTRTPKRILTLKHVLTKPKTPAMAEIAGSAETMERSRCSLKSSEAVATAHRRLPRARAPITKESSLPSALETHLQKQTQMQMQMQMQRATQTATRRETGRAMLPVQPIPRAMPQLHGSRTEPVVVDGGDAEYAVLAAPSGHSESSAWRSGAGSPHVRMRTRFRAAPRKPAPQGW